MLAAIEHAKRVVALCAKDSPRRKEQLATLWIDRCARTYVVARVDVKSGPALAKRMRERARITTLSEAAVFLAELDELMREAVHDTELSMLLKLVGISPQSQTIDESLEAAATFTVTLAILAGAGEDEASLQVNEAKDPGPQ